MVGRALLFAAWAALGAVASYGALYALTLFGLMILGTCLFAGLALPEAGGSRWPEILGLAAGPGLLLLVAAYNGGDTATGLAGAAIAATALVSYALVGRARCAHHPSG
jgi:hypothetical protein